MSEVYHEEEYTICFYSTRVSESCSILVNKILTTYVKNGILICVIYATHVHEMSPFS